MVKFRGLFIGLLWLAGITLFAQNQITAVKHLANRSSNPRKFVRFGNKLLFIANTNQQGDEWWITDGTEGGTQLLKDVYLGVGTGLYYADDSKINPTAVVDGKFYFTSQNPEGRCEIWQSDGTANGTVRLAEWNQTIRELTLLKDQIYIVDNTQKLWVLHPQTSASTQLADLGFFSRSAFFFSHNGKMYFYNVSQSYVYQTDGTVGGTSRIGYLGSTFSDPKMFVWNDYLYYYGDKGTFSGIGRLKNNASVAEVIYNRGDNNSSFTIGGDFEMRIKDDKIQLLEIVNNSYFDPHLIRLLESTDGKIFQEIRKVTLPTLVSNYLWIDNQFYGISKDGALLIYDFAQAATKTIADAWKGVQSEKTILKKLDNLLLIGENTATNSPKWFNLNDGKLSNAMVFPVNYGLLPSGIFHSVPSLNSADVELYKTDFTTLNADLLKNIKTAGNDDFEVYRVGKKLFFLTRDEGAPPSTTSLWITDGTSSGTVRLKDMPSLSASKILFTHNDGDLLYLQTQSAANENAIWVSDGTPEGTKELKRFAVQRAESFKVVKRDKQRMFLHPYVSFIYNIDTNGINDFKIGSNDNLGLEVFQLPTKVIAKAGIRLYSVDFDGKVLLMDSYLFNNQALAATANRVFYNRYTRFDYSTGEIVVTLVSTDGTTEGTKEVGVSLFGPFGLLSLKTDNVLVTYALNADTRRPYEIGVLNETGLSLRKAVNIGTGAVQQVYTVEDMVAVRLNNGRFLALNPRTAATTELRSLAYSDKVFAHQGLLYIVSDNCWSIDLTSFETKQLLPNDSRLSSGSYFQDKQDLYLTWDTPRPQTWLIRNQEVRKIGDFIMKQGPLSFNGRKAFVILKKDLPAALLYLADSLVTNLTYVRDVTNYGEEQWTVFNDYLVVSSFDTQAGVEPWTTDGTPENSRVLDNLQPLSESSYPSRYFVIDGKRLVCVAETGAMGKQLWGLRSPILAVEPQFVSGEPFIYPNPASHYFTVVTGKIIQSDTRLSLYNLAGQIVFQQQLSTNSNQTEISVENIISGLYFVIIDDGLGKRVTHKLLVLH